MEKQLFTYMMIQNENRVYSQVGPLNFEGVLFFPFMLVRYAYLKLSPNTYPVINSFPFPPPSNIDSTNLVRNPKRSSDSTGSVHIGTYLTPLEVHVAVTLDFFCPFIHR